jgi:dipeptidyl aminopeptidase/acylaminoacyl peptidase
MKTIFGGTAALAMLIASTDGAPAERPLTLEAFSRDWSEWAGSSPGIYLRWSPDGKSISFDWNPEHANVNSLYLADTAGAPPHKLTPEEAVRVPPWPLNRQSGVARGTSSTRDGRLMVWERDGDVFLFEGPSGRLTRLTNTEAAEQDSAFSYDQEQVTWQSEGNLFSYALDTGAVTQLTRFRAGGAAAAAQTDYERSMAKRQLELFEGVRQQSERAREQQARQRAELGARPAAVTLKPSQQVQNLVLSPDERTVTFILADSSGVLAEPSASVVEQVRYVTASGLLEYQKLPNGRVADPLRDYSLGVLNVADGKVRYVDTTSFSRRLVNWNPVVWSPDGKSAVAWAGARDDHDLWLCVIDVASATARPIFHETDEAWMRGFRAGRFLGEDGFVTTFLPDGKSVAFLSERDGWYHLYTASLEGGEPRQLTKGRFEVGRPTISKDGKRWFFLSSEGDLEQRHLYTMPIEGGARTRISPGEGWYDYYSLSPDESQVALLYGNPAEPHELYILPARPGASARRLTTSTTEEFRSYRWQRPEFVTFPDRSGWTVHASLLRPERPHPSRPAILYIHGTGWTQGVTKDFAPYLELNRPEFQFYADQGYTVMAVDYKASRGYGRESRVSVFKRVGEPEVESLVAAVDYLIKECGVDRRRIGIYGHSYGGTLVHYALFTRPGVFAGGVAEAGQVDYAQQGQTALATRLMGGTPVESPDAYRNASPITHAERFRDRLLILHGALDGNVTLQQPLLLAQRLMELKKTGWDMAIYPMEGHLPQLESSRLDMERRRFAFFESVLKGPRPSGAETNGGAR